MTYDDIKCYEPVNEVESAKVQDIKESIRTNGWVGAPILVHGESLLTGSHRLAALAALYEEDYEHEVFSQDIAADVTEIVESSLLAFEEENDYMPNIDYRNIGWLLAGSWVETHKGEINEW